MHLITRKQKWHRFHPTTAYNKDQTKYRNNKRTFDVSLCFGDIVDATVFNDETFEAWRII